MREQVEATLQRLVDTVATVPCGAAASGAGRPSRESVGLARTIVNLTVDGLLGWEVDAGVPRLEHRRRRRPASASAPRRRGRRIATRHARTAAPAPPTWRFRATRTSPPATSSPGSIGSPCRTGRDPRRSRWPTVVGARSSARSTSCSPGPDRAGRGRLIDPARPPRRASRRRGPGRARGDLPGRAGRRARRTPAGSTLTPDRRRLGRGRSIERAVFVGTHPVPAGDGGERRGGRRLSRRRPRRRPDARGPHRSGLRRRRRSGARVRRRPRRRGDGVGAGGRRRADRGRDAARRPQPQEPLRARRRHRPPDHRLHAGCHPGGRRTCRACLRRRS